MRILIVSLLALAFLCGLTAGTPTPTGFAPPFSVHHSKPGVELDQPTVVPSAVKIYPTKSSVLRIHGSNFPSSDSTDLISLKFEPPLVQGVDFTTLAANGDGVSVILLSDRAWRTEPGQLLLKSVDLISESGVPSRYPTPGGGIQVAQVTEDPTVGTDMDNLVGSVSLDTSNQRVYQSVLQKSITIAGRGFQTNLALVLDPHLELNEDYVLTVTSPTTVVLNLLPGKKWRYEPGFLSVRAMQSGDAEYAPNLVNGICIAEVFADPEVFYTAHGASKEAGAERFKVVTFDENNVADVKLALDPAVAGTLRIESVLDEHVMFVKVHRDARMHDISNLFTIDTGAGRVPIATDPFNTYADDDGNDDYPLLPERNSFQPLDLTAWELAESAAAVRRALQSTVAGCWVTVQLVPVLAVLICLTALRLVYTSKRASHTCVETLTCVELV